MRRWRCNLAWLGLFGLLWGADVAAQVLGPNAGAPVTAAAPDTVSADITAPAGWPVPAAAAVWPAEPRFGDPAALLFDFAGEAPAAGADSLTSSADWLEIRGGAGGQRGWRRWFTRRQTADDVASGAPPPAAGQSRLVVPVQIYATGPAQVGWRGGPRTVVFPVRSRLGDAKEAAPVREPRGLGWYVGRLVAAALALVALVVLLLWLRRRLRGILAVDRPLPAPAWMAAALALWRLDQENLPAGGDGRVFLDRLAAILRAFVADRFHVPACELTAAELTVAAADCPWATGPLEDLVALIAAADGDRYAPTRVDASRCRADLARAVALIAAARVEATHTPVEAALRVEAAAAWDGLRRRHLHEGSGEVAA